MVEEVEEEVDGEVEEKVIVVEGDGEGGGGEESGGSRGGGERGGEGCGR